MKKCWQVTDCMKRFRVNERFEKLLCTVRKMKSAGYDSCKVKQMSNNEELRMKIVIQCCGDVLSDDMLSSVRKSFEYL